MIAKLIRLDFHPFISAGAKHLAHLSSSGFLDLLFPLTPPRPPFALYQAQTKTKLGRKILIHNACYVPKTLQVFGFIGHITIALLYNISFVFVFAFFVSLRSSKLFTAGSFLARLNFSKRISEISFDLGNAMFVFAHSF